MRSSFHVILIVMVLQSVAVKPQTIPNRYEVELFANPNAGRKDTREVNAVIVFEKEMLRIESRRRPTTLKEFKYSDVKSVEHSFSKAPGFGPSTTAIILSAMVRLPIFLTRKKEKHWLTIVSDDNFAVLKIENDNYRLIKLELAVKKIEVLDLNEDQE
jgi:hypothetical protein